MAQLDSASDSDSEGRRFESCRVGQKDTRKRSVQNSVACVFFYAKQEKIADFMAVYPFCCFFAYRLRDLFFAFDVARGRNSGDNLHALRLIVSEVIPFMPGTCLFA